jgi:hypothetical protein
MSGFTAHPASAIGALSAAKRAFKILTLIRHAQGEPVCGGAERLRGAPQ